MKSGVEYLAQHPGWKTPRKRKPSLFREMLDALKRARQEIYGSYLAAGGDDEAMTNPSMIKTSQLINKLDDLIAKAEGRRPGQ